MTDPSKSDQNPDAGDPEPFEALKRLELQSRRLYFNQPLWLPGLLQVPGYAAAMIGAILGLKAGDPEVERRVEIRMRRASAFDKRLRGPDAPEVWLPVDEAVLRRGTGGPAVMREQIDRLVEVSTMDNVHVGIIRLGSGAYRGLGGAYEVHEAANGDAAVFFEGAYRDELGRNDCIRCATMPRQRDGHGGHGGVGCGGTRFAEGDHQRSVTLTWPTCAMKSLNARRSKASTAPPLSFESRMQTCPPSVATSTQLAPPLLELVHHLSARWSFIVPSRKHCERPGTNGSARTRAPQAA